MSTAEQTPPAPAAGTGLPVATPTRSARPRQVAVTLAVAPLLLWVLTLAGGGIASGPWTALVALTAVLGAATVASYVPAPGTGWAPAWGCSSCAVIAAVTVPASALILGSAPGQTPTASLALMVAAFGLAQRLRDPRTCPTPPHPRA